MSSLTENRIGEGFIVSGGAGTTVVRGTQPCTFHRIVIPGTCVGTIKFHDAPSAAGTTNTSNFLTLVLPWPNQVQPVEVGIRLKSGLVYEATGTPVLLGVVE